MTRLVTLMHLLLINENKHLYYVYIFIMFIT